MAAEPLRREPGDCPELETIAAYLDGQLSVAEREGVAEHLATCETCYFVFAEAAASKVAMPADPALPWWKNRRIILPSGAGLAAAATIVLAVSGVFSWGRSEAPELTGLVAAVGDERSFEPRLTGGFAYGPLRTLRSAAPTSVGVSADVRIAAASIEKETGGSHAPQDLHARGIAALILGDVDQAVGALEQAAAQQSDNPRILSDLGAAYLVRADRKAQPEDLSKAVASLNHAVTANHLLTEALFNRAYALQRLGLSNEASEAWRAYLRIDDQSGWAEEARTQLRLLAEQR